jgi:hypothetical protein
MKPLRLDLDKVRQNVKPLRDGAHSALRRVSFRPKWLSLTLIVLVLVFGFSPISRLLLSTVSGSFSPTPYTSLALKASSHATRGIVAGQPVPVRLVDRTGRPKTYHWSATQNGRLVSLGDEALDSGQAVTILIPTRGATKGALRISLAGTQVFVTVPILRS